VTRPTRWLHDFLGNAYVSFAAWLASVVALVWYAYDQLKPAPAAFSLVLYAVVTAVVLAVGIYSIRVRQENIHFRQFTRILHRINHDYRDTLGAVFRNTSPEYTASEFSHYLKDSERKTLKSACQKISKIYTFFTHSQCTVTVKLITMIDGKAYCETCERSEENCERDQTHLRRFELNTGANTGFDKALMFIPGTVSHFHSADLSTERDYHNQRDHWPKVYASTIVVPIRFVNPDKLGTKEASDDIGFLCVDTLSTNRLNDHWHIELLAAFADQMYNFISLMRGKYSLRHPITAIAGQVMPK